MGAGSVAIAAHVQGDAGGVDDHAADRVHEGVAHGFGRLELDAVDRLAPVGVGVERLWVFAVDAAQHLLERLG